MTYHTIESDFIDINIRYRNRSMPRVQDGRAERIVSFNTNHSHPAQAPSFLRPNTTTHMLCGAKIDKFD